MILQVWNVIPLFTKESVMVQPTSKKRLFTVFSTSILLAVGALLNAPVAAHATDSAPIVCTPSLTVTAHAEALTIDGLGNLYILEGAPRGSETNLIQKMDKTSGVTTLIAGGYVRDLPDDLRIGKPHLYGDGGPAVDAGLFWPVGISSDATGNLYISDYGIFNPGDGSNRLRKITTDGIINTISGNGTYGHSGDGGPAIDATMYGPRAITSSAAGDIYFVDSFNNKIRKIDHTSHIISTIAGTGTAGSSVETGIATEVNLSAPNSLTLDSAGNLYFADFDFGVIQKINLNQSTPTITTIAGQLTPPANNKIILGDGGLASAANLRGPYGLTSDSQDNLYFFDNYGSVIRKITASDHKINTIAGLGDWDSGATRATGASALSQNITGNAMVVDADGKIFIAEAGTIAILDQATGNLNYLSGGYPESYDGTQKYSPFCGQTSVVAGPTPNSQVATIPSGATAASIPATSSLPAISLNFGGTVPAEVTVSPVTTNPGTPSTTPFAITGSTKIVDIHFDAPIVGTVTVCLDGASTDHLYHFTNNAWVDLPNRTYFNGQVCGDTDSFSPFAAAEPVAIVVVPAEFPATAQQSKIATLASTPVTAGSGVSIVINGSFPEKISAIDLNGVALSTDSWVQAANAITITLAKISTGEKRIQIYNGSLPLLKEYVVTVSAPTKTAAPATVGSGKSRVKYIQCIKKGKGVRTVYGLNPKCPDGYSTKS